MEFLAEENINPAFIRVNYSLRGWLFRRAIEIRQELARVSNNSNNHDILAFYTLNNKALLVGKAVVSFLDLRSQTFFLYTAVATTVLNIFVSHIELFLYFDWFLLCMINGQFTL